MVEKTKISPRVVWLEDYIYNSKERNSSNGKISGTGGRTTPITLCTATPFSNGYDEVTLYSYDNVIINNRYRHSAYFACDYVQ